MVKNVFRFSKLTHHVNNEQKRSFLTIINQSFEGYRTTFGKNLVKNTYKACFDVTDYHSAIFSVGTSSLRSIVGQFEYDQIIDDRNRLNKECLFVVGDSVEHWGLQTNNTEIQSFGPLDASVARTLEKQMDTERDRQQQELNTRAKINISEGEKQLTILHSEGQLIAARNLAKATLLATQKQADGQRYLIEQGTLALTEKIEA